MREENKIEIFGMGDTYVCSLTLEIKSRTATTNSILRFSHRSDWIREYANINFSSPSAFYIVVPKFAH